MSHCTYSSSGQELLAGLRFFCARQRFISLDGCVARLAALIERSPGRSVHECEAEVRHIVAEHCRVDEGGDAIPFDLQSTLFDVRSLMREMERLRKNVFEVGASTHAPVTPLMVG